MAQRKGQTGNPNGRPRGSRNKATAPLRQWVASLLDNNRQAFETDLKKVEPMQRLTVLEKLLQYALPKQTHQTTTVAEQISAEYAELEKLLQAAPEDAVLRISEKVLELKKLSDAQGQNN